jgi:hypothetical protein
MELDFDDEETILPALRRRCARLTAWLVRTNRVQEPARSPELVRPVIPPRGVEYSVVQLVDRTGWRWEVKFADGKINAGVTGASRAVAIRLAESEIDRALRN